MTSTSRGPAARLAWAIPAVAAAWGAAGEATAQGGKGQDFGREVTGHLPSTTPVGGPSSDRRPEPCRNFVEPLSEKPCLTRNQFLELSVAFIAAKVNEKTESDPISERRTLISKLKLEVLPSALESIATTLALRESAAFINISAEASARAEDQARRACLQASNFLAGMMPRSVANEEAASLLAFADPRTGGDVDWKSARQTLLSLASRYLPASIEPDAASYEDFLKGLGERSLTKTEIAEGTLQSRRDSIAAQAVAWWSPSWVALSIGDFNLSPTELSQRLSSVSQLALSDHEALLSLARDPSCTKNSDDVSAGDIRALSQMSDGTKEWLAVRSARIATNDLSSDELSRDSTGQIHPYERAAQYFGHLRLLAFRSVAAEGKIPQWFAAIKGLEFHEHDAAPGSAAAVALSDYFPEGPWSNSAQPGLVVKERLAGPSNPSGDLIRLIEELPPMAAQWLRGPLAPESK